MPQATSQINVLQQEAELIKANNKDALEKLYCDTVICADKFRNEISTLNTKVAPCGAELDFFKVTNLYLIRSLLMSPCYIVKYPLC